MSFGFAIVHPQRLAAALDEALPEKAGWDEGADLVLCAAGVDLGDDPFGTFLGQLRAEVLDLFGQLQSLVLPGGPWAALSGLFSGAGDTVGAWVRWAGDLLAGLDPATLTATLIGHVDAFFGHFPAFDLHTIDDRLRRLAQAALDVLRRPLLGGREDGAAHRAYRGAALLLAKLEPLLAQLDAGLAPYDPVAALRAAITAGVAALDAGILGGIAAVGRILRDDVGPVMDAAASLSVSVSAGGPDGLVTGEPTHRDDADPQPFRKGHWMWIVDLGTELLAMFWMVWAFQRSRGVKLWGEWVAFLLAAAWRIFRMSVRLFVQPTWLSKDSPGFVRMLFGEWGDLFVRLFLMFIPSIADLAEYGDRYWWSNFVMGLGNRFLVWYTVEAQPRMIYHYCRSVWYLRSWKADHAAPAGSPAGTRTGPRFTRVIWAAWPAALPVVMLMGLLLRGESYDLQSFFHGGHEGATAALFLAPIFQIIGSVISSWLLLGQAPGSVDYTFDSFDMIAFVVAVFLVIFIGVETLASTNVGADAGAALRVILYLLFGIPLLLVVIGQGVSGASSAGTSHWYEKLGAAEAWFIAVLGALGTGLLSMVVWWFVRRDGEDADDDFAGLDASSSPYFLPYPRGETWQCGQGFHGIFSHTWHSGKEPFWQSDDKGNTWEEADNLFAYDFNNAYGEPACAARAGFVVSVDVTQEDGGTEANSVVVQHWDWAEHHDPGTNDERQLTQAKYLHLAKDKARCEGGQLIVQGYNLAAIDDTGISALNHLHFQIYRSVRRVSPSSSGGPMGANTRDFTMPTVFRDEDVRGYRSFGHIDGKPKSLAYYVSENAGDKTADVTTQNLIQPFTLIALPGGTGGHTHTFEVTAAHLGTGALPATITLFSNTGDTLDNGNNVVGDGHIHRLVLTADQIRAMLRRETVTCEAAVGVVLPVATTLPSESSHTHTVRLKARGVGGLAMQLTSPPGARLISDAPGPYDLLGEQVVVDADGDAACFWLLGVVRPAVVGEVAIDREPVGQVSASVGSAALTIPAPGDGSARAAASRWSAAWGSGVVRPEPVIVLESLARGTDARVHLGASDSLGVWGLPNAEVQVAGTGVVADLVSAALVPVVQAALSTTPALQIPTSMSVGGVLSIHTGAATVVSSFNGSHARIRDVLQRAYNVATGELRSNGALPLAPGRIVLNGLSVPLLAAGAQVQIAQVAGRLTAALLTNEPLVVSLNGGTQTVVFRAEDVVAADDDATLSRALARIVTSVDGLRAWRQGTTLVLETVAAGAGVSLSATKGAFATPTLVGAAPLLPGGVRVQDTSAVTPAELKAVLDDAVARSTRPAAPFASVADVAGAVVITFTAGTPIPTIGDRAGWQVLGALDGSGNATITLTPPATRNGPLWVDLALGADTWRVAVDADGARFDLGPLSRAVPASSTLQVGAAGGLTAVPLPEGASTLALVRALQAVPGLAVRTAWRWSLEASQWRNAGALTVSGSNPSALPTMGFLGATSYSGVADGPDREPIRMTAGSFAGATAVPGLVGPNPDDDSAAFVVDHTATTVTLTARAGETLVVSATPSDPTGLSASGGTLTSVPITPGLLAGTSTVWTVLTRRGSTRVSETRAQVAAAPAILRADAPPVTWTWTNPPPPSTPPPPPPAPVITFLPSTQNRDRLVLTVSEPGAADVEMTVDLRGTTTLVDVVQRIALEAPLVQAWVANGALHLQTRGAGTAWRLRAVGAQTLTALGFSPARLDADGGITQAGTGNVVDLRAVTATEVAAAFSAAVRAAAWTNARHYTTTVSGDLVQLRTLGAAITVTAEPAALQDALAMQVVSGGVDIPSVGGRLRLTSGVIRVRQGADLRQVVIVFGSHAAVTAEGVIPSDPSALAALFTALASQPLNVTVDTVPRSWTLSTGISDLPGLVRDLRQQLVAHITTVSDASGVRLRIASRRRGSGSSVLVGSGGAAGLLGFFSQLDSQGPGQEPGLGTFSDLDDLSTNDLRSALQENTGATAIGESQSVLAVTTDASGVITTPASGLVAWEAFPTWITSAAVNPGRSVLFAPPTPGSPVFSGPSLRYTCSTGPLVAQGIRFRVATNVATATAAFDRHVVAALWANPARLATVTLPADLSPLDGKVLRVDGGGGAVDVLFSGLAALSGFAQVERLVATIEDATGGRVRAIVLPSAPTLLTLESADAGSAAALSLAAQSANDARAELGSPPAVTVTGTGNVGRLSAVTPDEILLAIRGGFLVENDLRADPVWNDNTFDPLVRRLELDSARAGCASAVLPITVPTALRFRRSMERGPARGASVVLPRLAAPVSPSGSLFIKVNEGNGPRGVPETVVEVVFDGTPHSPLRVARRIHAALDARGVGVAGLFRDGADGWRIVVESRLPGLQGTVRLPVDPTSAGVRTALGLTDTTVNRGWPGVGFSAAPAMADPGLRTAPSSSGMVIGRTWRLNPPGGATPAVIQLGAADAVMSALASRLDAAAAGIAISRLHEVDGCLHVELIDRNAKAVVFDGATPPAPVAGSLEDLSTGIFGQPALPPPRIGAMGDMWVDEGMQLRSTNLVRTCRLVALLADGTATGREVDSGWVRMVPDERGKPNATPAMARGRWAIRVRAEGARSDGYSPRGEMISSFGTATVDGVTFAVVHQARYWFALNNQDPGLGPILLADGSIAVETMRS